MQRKQRYHNLVRTLVLGIGGSGTQTIDRLLSQNVVGVELAVMDGPTPELENSNGMREHRFTPESGWRAGDPAQARAAVAADGGAVRRLLQGAEILFLVAGLGGGTGSGAAPAVAEMARSMDILTIAVVTMPYDFEHARRHSAAARSLHRLEQVADTVLVISNDRLLTLNEGPPEQMTAVADDILRQTLGAVNALVNATGLINVDFADVRAVMSGGTRAVITCGRGYGRQRAVKAAEEAITSTLLGQTIDGATGLVFNVTGGADMSLLEVSQIASLMRSRVADDANIIFGTLIDPGLEDEIRITVIATGCETSFYRPVPPPQTRAPGARRPARSGSRPATTEIPIFQ
jgi:cell division protein FtsZ